MQSHVNNWRMPRLGILGHIARFKNEQPGWLHTALRTTFVVTGREKYMWLLIKIYKKTCCILKNNIVIRNLLHIYTRLWKKNYLARTDGFFPTIAAANVFSKL